MRVLHVGLRVADPDRSVTFYSGLGFRVVGSVAESPLGALTMLALPDDEFVSLELVHDPSAGAVEIGSGFHHLVVQTEDLGSVLERAPGGSDAATPTPAGGPRIAWLTDPDGYRIELVQWPPRHPAGMTEDDFVA